MTAPTRSSVIAFKKEVTEGELENPTASDFVPIRDGFIVTGELETVTSDEFIDDIGASKSFVTKEIPKGTQPSYLKHSGVEGQEPQYGPLIESCIGQVTTNSTEYDTIAGSTAGSASARAIMKVDTGEGVNFIKGQALLIKDAINGYEIRNVYDISTDDLSLNFNIDNAPALGVNLGKAIHYSPLSVGQPTFSVFHYGASSNSDYKQAIAGCRTTTMDFNFPANGFAEINFEYEGIEIFSNFIEITSSNKYIDFKDDGAGGELTVTLDEKFYKTPIDLADAIASKMTAQSAGSEADTYTVVFDSVTGKFTITTDGLFLSLLFGTGTNTANSTDTTIGFTGGDETGATTYTSDTEQSYDPSVTPTYDVSDNIILKDSEICIGSYNEFINRSCIEATCSVSTPKTDVPDLTAVSGIDSSIFQSREVTLTAKLILRKHEIGLFQKFLKNTTTTVMFNTGPKTANNWVAGKCFNLYMANSSITSNTNEDNEGYRILTVTAVGFVDEDQKDIHVNFI